MKIIKITKKKNNTYEIIFSDQTSLNFYDDVIIRYNLLKPRELSKSEIEEIIKYNDEVSAYKTAIKFIAYKLRTKKEVEKKLKDFPDYIINKTIDRLTKEKYLNDELYIKSYTNDQINLGSKGPKKIYNELLASGLNPSLIASYLEEYPREVWQEKINKIITKKYKANRNLSNQMFIQKVKKDLINLGYSLEDINDVLNEFKFSSDKNNLKELYQKEMRKLSNKYEGEILKNKLKQRLYQKGYSIEDINNLIND